MMEFNFETFAISVVKRISKKIVSQSGNNYGFMGFLKSSKRSKRKNNFITPFSSSVGEGNRGCGSIQ
jgi:hypothetical protein